MTLPEYFAWERQQDSKFEYVRPVVVQRPDVTATHAVIQGNILLALHSRLKPKPYCVVGGALKFFTGRGTVRYTDGMVIPSQTCRKATFTESPLVVFEVLSSETSRTDRINKALDYQATSSLQHYVMVEEEAAQATVYHRTKDLWTHDILSEKSILALPAIGVEFPISELYLEIDFLFKNPRL